MTEKSWNPGMLMEASGAYWKSCTIHAGVKLDLFTRIGRRHLTIGQICESLGGEPRGVAPLLNALAAMGLLEKKEDAFKNTSFSLRFLSKESPGYLGHILMHHHHLMGSWQRLDEVVIKGQSVREEKGPKEGEELESFLMGMYNSASFTAPEVARCLDLSGCKTLLDLGGGPGTFAIHFCMEHPDLSAWVFDLPTTRPFAEETIAKHGMADRITFKPYDFMIDEEPTLRFDAAWLSHIIHSLSEDEARGVIGRTVEALNSGGRLLIHDFLLNDTMDGPEFPALFSLNMLAVTPSGRAYSELEIGQMMEEAGLSEIRRINYGNPKGAAVLEGRKV